MVPSLFLYGHTGTGKSMVVNSIMLSMQVNISSLSFSTNAVDLYLCNANDMYDKLLRLKQMHYVHY